MFSQLLSRIIILVLGNLYPAYASFKAVKSKNAREYARWMMYWIVFAIFTVGETFTDILLSWFPFYYELKIAFVVWLLLPTFKGSSFIYRKLLHPYLIKNEKEIDLYIEKSREIGSQALVTLGRQGFDAAQRTIAQKGPLWRSVSAQYLDQIVSNRDIDYDAEDQTDAAGSSGHGRGLNAGDVAAGHSDDANNRRQVGAGVGSTAGHRPVIKQQSAAPVHHQQLRQRSGSHDTTLLPPGVAVSNNNNLLNNNSTLNNLLKSRNNRLESLESGNSQHHFYYSVDPNYDDNPTPVDYDDPFQDSTQNSTDFTSANTLARHVVDGYQRRTQNVTAQLYNLAT